MPLASVTNDGSTPVIPARKRAVLILQNLSDADIHIAFEPVSVDGASDAGIQLAAGGGSISLPELPYAQAANNTAIFAVHAGEGTKHLNYIERGGA